MHKAVRSKCKSKVKLDHLVTSVAKPCELTFGERGGQFIFRDYLSVTY